ncbi:uncharacterized protein LOC102809701 [Saccoglossus kowalevskii]|uniref:Uncharacterized protein LOC102809701 n=1 Tax=Saccoglossus kowalevskii TaxID=10224 RepID=A0ABM0LX33_SACKO|nr:PREDICTED: uncharacterized protein LOC102809701 [Saccoglossus kowalevskii]
MGCTESIGTAVAGMRGNNVHIANLSKSPRFSSEQISELRRTWPKLACDLTGNGAQVFLQIFAINENIKILFPFRYVPVDILSQNEVFRGHSRRFMQAVGACVENLENLDGDVTTLFVGLGKKHIHFEGFKVDYFSTYVTSMQTVWDIALTGHHYDKQTKQSWTQIFEFVITRMAEGYHIAMDEQEAKKKNQLAHENGKII